MLAILYQEMCGDHFSAWGKGERDYGEGGFLFFLKNKFIYLWQEKYIFGIQQMILQATICTKTVTEILQF